LFGPLCHSPRLLTCTKQTALAYKLTRPRPLSSTKTYIVIMLIQRPVTTRASEPFEKSCKQVAIQRSNWPKPRSVLQALASGPSSGPKCQPPRKETMRPMFALESGIDANTHEKRAYKARANLWACKHAAVCAWTQARGSLSSKAQYLVDMGKTMERFRRLWLEA
jgi:hypothetical protein